MTTTPPPNHPANPRIRGAAAAQRSLPPVAGTTLTAHSTHPPSLHLPHLPISQLTAHVISIADVCSLLHLGVAANASVELDRQLLHWGRELPSSRGPVTAVKGEDRCSCAFVPFLYPCAPCTSVPGTHNPRRLICKLWYKTSLEHPQKRKRGVRPYLVPGLQDQL